MRDILVVVLFLVLIIRAFKNPFIGLLTYYWISFMNPHRFTWGFAYSLPLAMIASVVTVLSSVIHYRQLQFPLVRETYLYLVLWIFITITTLFSFYPKYAWIEWTLVTKIFFMTFFIVLIVNDKKKILFFILAIVFFIGFVGIKGAIFGLMTGGSYKVWGPPESFIEDNNSLGLALIMISPFGYFIKDIYENKWIKRGLILITSSMILSAILTYSRGALLGLLAIGFLVVLKSKHKIIFLISIVILISIGISIAPAEWLNRMSTIQDYEQDDSANMRLNSWAMSFNLATDNLFGGGFDCFTAEQYHKYAPDPELGILKSGAGSVAHSIYFEVLASHGFIGLIIYLTCIFSMLFSLKNLNKLAGHYSELKWITLITNALIMSTIGYMVSGAFLSRAFFDLFWALYSVAICLKHVTNLEIQKLLDESNDLSMNMEK